MIIEEKVYLYISTMEHLLKTCQTNDLSDICKEEFEVSGDAAEYHFAYDIESSTYLSK